MKTINLRAYRANPHAPAMIFTGILVALILLNGLAEWRAPTTTTTTPTPALIYVLSTREPRIAPTADPRVAEIDALKARLTELEARDRAAAPIVYQEMSAEAAPTPDGPGYTAHTDQGPVWVPDDATPVPSGTTYTGPLLSPAATNAPSGPRLCTGFGDWRDYDPMYEASSACHQVAP